MSIRSISVKKNISILKGNHSLENNSESQFTNIGKCFQGHRLEFKNRSYRYFVFYSKKFIECYRRSKTIVCIDSDEDGNESPLCLKCYAHEYNHAIAQCNENKKKIVEQKDNTLICPGCRTIISIESYKPMPKAENLFDNICCYWCKTQFCRICQEKFGTAPGTVSFA